MSLAAIARFQADPLRAYDPCAGMIAFHQSQAALRLLRAPNQVGKTWAGCAEDWWFLTDTHPYRKRRPGPVKLWIMLADLENQYREFCEKLHALGPPDVLAPGCYYVEGEGYKYRGAHQILLRNGSQVVFRSGEGSQMAAASGTADALHIDEPPKQPHFLEATRAVLHRSGPIWLTMTPVGRPVHWLKLRVEGDPSRQLPPSEPWEQFVPALTLENVTTIRAKRPTRSPESIAIQRNRYLGTPEYAQRCEGAWEGVATGRRFPAFDPGKHVLHSLDDLPPQQFVRASFDWGESTATQIGYLLGIEGQRAPYRVTVLSEIPAAAAGTPAADARALVHALADLGLNLAHLSAIRGDVNSAGKGSGGASVNQLFASALALHPGSPKPPLSVDTPQKGHGSVLAGERALQTALQEDRLFVYAGCSRLLQSLSYYTGAESELKHPLDALRYGVADLLTDAGRPASPTPTLRTF